MRTTSSPSEDTRLAGISCSSTILLILAQLSSSPPVVR